MSDAMTPTGGAPAGRVMAPTDWQTPAMQARIRARYAAERRFRAYGFFAVLLTGLFLAFLLGSMVKEGAKGFVYHYVTVPIDFSANPLPLTAANLAADDIDRQFAASGLDELVAFAADEALGPGGSELVAAGAWRAVRDAIKADPAKLSGTHEFLVPLTSDIDVAAKGTGSPAAEAAHARLAADGKVVMQLNRAFLGNADATDPAVAGIYGALVGSLMTILIAFLIAFPTGVFAAVYLEEYAGRNRWTELIEVSINNLAAVPSIIFGLLALAVFINAFGICNASPLVGGLTLALMTMPVIVIASRNAIKSVPPSIRDAALGVGASPVQVVFHHVLPLALPGIMTGTIIGMARALGETAPLLLIGMRAFIGDVPNGLCAPATVLPMQIFLWSDQVDRGFVEKTSAAIIVLLVVLLSMNALAVYLRNRFEKRW